MFITTINNLTVYQFVWHVIDSNTFLICSNDSALVVDPVDSEELYQFIENKSFCKLLIVITHCHHDHICGLNTVRKLIPDNNVVASKLCSTNMQDPKKNFSMFANVIFTEVKENLIIPFACEPADIVFDKQMLVEWETHSLQLLSFSGHSQDGICCILDNKYMFSGDTILPIPTVTRLPGGSTERFWEEDMPRLEQLTHQIERVFPGHGMPGRLKDMLAVNVKPERYRGRNR